MIRAVKPQTVFLELDRARATKLMHEHDNKDDQGGLNVRHLFAASYPIHPIAFALLFTILANVAQTPYRILPCAALSMQAHCLQAFFANIASGAGLNMPQELVKQSMAGARHIHPEGCSRPYSRIASCPSLCMSPGPALASSVCAA